LRTDSAGGREYCAELLSKLVDIESVSPDERAVMLFLERELAGHGFKPKRIVVDGPRFNLLCGAGSGSPRVCLCAHADTVPPNGESVARASVEGDLLYGLGACDDKASIAAMTIAFMDVASRSPTGALDLLITVGEEVDSKGVKTALDQGYECNYALVGEPTGLDIVNGHPGQLFLTFTAKGLASHGSMPDNGINAIERMMALLDEVRGVISRFAPHPRIGASSLNIGEIHAGDRPNRVPDTCISRVDVRLAPPVTVAQMLGEIEKVIASKDWAGMKVDKQEESLDTPLDSSLVSAVRRSAAKLGIDSKPVAWRAWTEAEAFRTRLGAPAVVIGPGDLKVAHAAKECVSVSQTQLAANLYADVVQTLFGGG